MGFLKQTLLPKNNVSLMAVDARMETRMKNTLKDYGIELIEIPPCSGLAEPVAGHVDMQLIHVGDNVLVCQPGLPSDILKKLKEYGFDVYTGNTLLQKDYPLDVAYNVAIVGRWRFITQNAPIRWLPNFCPGSISALSMLTRDMRNVLSCLYRPKALLPMIRQLRKLRVKRGLMYFRYRRRKTYSYPDTVMALLAVLQGL